MSRSFADRLARQAQSVPFVFWILAAFLLAYMLFFVQPVFLRSNVMQQFQPVAAAEHLGIDLKMRLSWSAYSLDPSLPIPDGDGTVFPPLANLLFAPLQGLGFATAYSLLTVMTVMLFVASSLFVPLLLGTRKRLAPVAVIFCITGLVSYGLQFELERGQWNVVAVFLALLSVWVFHRFPRQRLLAYALFVLSVQLKVYPVVFIVLLVSEWRAWRENLGRLAALVGANIVLLFVQGLRSFRIWIAGLSDWSANPWIWEGNPSIESAVSLIAQYADKQGWGGVSTAAGGIQTALTLVVVACLAAILVHALRRPVSGPNPYYLLAAAIGCLLIPSGGYDYRLSMLVGPITLLLLAEETIDGIRVDEGGLLRRLAITLLSFAYASTLFPPDLKPYYLANNFPALFAMVMLVTILALTSPPPAPTHASLPHNASPESGGAPAQSG